MHPASSRRAGSSLAWRRGTGWNASSNGPRWLPGERAGSRYAPRRRQHAKLLISQDARMTYRCAQSARLQKARVPHLAWGFNFTTLPRGLYRRLMASVFTDVDRFVAYSSLERSLYADYFRIDPARIDVLLWGVAQPLVEPADTPIESGDYICAVGGNARDYRTLFAAMAQVPEIPLVAVLRPANVVGLDVPSNVRLHFNLPVGKTNNIVAFSRFMVLPLAGSEVPCGHVTLVAAMHLKKALVVTDSRGVSDYVQDGVNSLLGARWETRTHWRHAFANCGMTRRDAKRSVPRGRRSQLRTVRRNGCSITCAWC